MMKKFTKTEFRLLIALFAAYTAAYISRCNLSPALDAIAGEFGISTATVGLLPTCFAIPYGIGQVFAGLLADKLPASRLMGIGLFGSACANILFSFSPAFPLLLVLWTLNGLLQSLIWTPVVRTMATRFRKEVRDSAVFFISLTLIFGYLIAWALSGLLTSLLSWRAAFRTSGLVTAAVAVPSILCMKRIPVDFTARPAEQTASVQAPVRHLLLRTNLLLLLAACFANGYVRDGITNWATKLLMDTQGIDLSSAVGIILIIPAVNFLGIRLGQAIYRRTGGNPYLSCGIMYTICAALCVLLPVSLKALAFCVIALAAASSMTYGLNPLLTTILPIQFSHLNRVALAAGLMDAMIYVGSSFSGSFAGFLSDQYGWAAVFVSWAVLSLIGTLVLVWAQRVAKRGKQQA